MERLRRVVFIVGNEELPNLESLEALSVEVYRINTNKNIDVQVDSGLLNDVCTPLRLAFVGPDSIKPTAEGYRGKWFKDSTDLIDFFVSPISDDPSKP